MISSGNDTPTRAPERGQTETAQVGVADPANLYLAVLGLITLIWAYLPLIAPDFTICAIFTLYMHSSIETAPLCKILEQSDHYSWRYCILKIWRIQVSSANADWVII